MKSKPVKKAVRSPSKAKLEKPSPAKPVKKTEAAKPAATKAIKPAKTAKTTQAAKKVKATTAAKPALKAKEKLAPKVSPKAEAKSMPKNPAPVTKSTKENMASPAKAPVKSKPRQTKTTPLEKLEENFSLNEFTISLTKPGESKEKIWRIKNFQQFPAQREFGFPESSPVLPNEFHEPKLVLMPKDPEYMFCYWEIPANILFDREKEKIPDANYQEALKINWEVKSLFEPNYTFVPVFFWAKKWYFGVPQTAQSYQVELGWLSDSGHFISILGSNFSELPESWSNTQKRLSMQGDVLSYSTQQTQILGSSENFIINDFKSIGPEWNLSSESMTSSSWSKKPSESQSKPAKSSGKSRGRLEVSGNVFTGTQVQINGKSIAIDKHGNFRIEFPYNKDILSLILTSTTGVTRALTYDLKELVLT